MSGTSAHVLAGVLKWCIYINEQQYLIVFKRKTLPIYWHHIRRFVNCNYYHDDHYYQIETIQTSINSLIIQRLTHKINCLCIIPNQPFCIFHCTVTCYAAFVTRVLQFVFYHVLQIIFVHLQQRYCHSLQALPLYIILTYIAFTTLINVMSEQASH